MNQHITIRKIEHNGVVVTERGEMMSLTDMWKAAGSPPGRGPADWLALVSSKEFVSCVEASIDAGNPGIKAYRSGVAGKRGGGGTFGHWQIGLAYAKYLDPQFHMLCNEIVRERMQGQAVSVANLPPEVLEMIRRDDGISRMLSGKVKRMEDTLDRILATITPPQPVIVRRGQTAGQILRAACFPPMKGLAAWFGNLLVKFGCQIDTNGCGEMGLTKARHFDPDKAHLFLMNGGKAAVHRKMAERMGQGRLNLSEHLNGDQIETLRAAIEAKRREGREYLQEADRLDKLHEAVTAEPLHPQH